MLSTPQLISTEPSSLSLTLANLDVLLRFNPFLDDVPIANHLKLNADLKAFKTISGIGCFKLTKVQTKKGRHHCGGPGALALTK